MKKVVIALTLALVGIGMMVAVVTYAQGPGGDANTEPEGPGGEMSINGINVPPPPGQKVLYMFSGIADNQNSGGTIATSIHCTNIHPSNTAEVKVEFVDKDNAGTFSITSTVSAGHTATFSTRNTAVYAESGPYWGGVVSGGITDDLNQGSGRIMAATSGSTDLICTAQVIDPLNPTPVFISSLELYRP